MNRPRTTGRDAAAGAALAHAMRGAAIRLDSLGAHELAEPLLARALELVARSDANPAIDRGEILNDLARCQFNGGRFAHALATYERLLAALLDEHGPADELVVLTRAQIRRCAEGLRYGTATASLQGAMHAWIRHAPREASGHAANDRVRRVARRLIARGRLAAGARMMARWIDARLARGMLEDEETIRGIRAHAIGLWEAGELPFAAQALRAVVAIRHRRWAHGSGRAELASAVSDWGACLAALGQTRSARDLATLAKALGAEDGR